MNKLWVDEAWEEYLYWQVIDKKIVKKINELLKDISRNGVSEGIGKPESLKYRKAWSRRINKEHRLVYFIENSNIVILSCKGHYEE
ncbi:Txe/YoeB family addiction module toxin [Pseudoleptotrichia goodfellowii]|jgi:toxin-antitoxin system, toxin component, Txe/YoeB family|uniref:Putative mRNA interferase YoeB n=1 Tax=Pseudoleptotrichia goodfellowii TaxID=157692 RepID=A0A510JC60_9FUSO|nr:Txe/YoeB family addiction module toxin [Pseudoleptotrichia goodfellowii]BBM36882.1 addiction module toxin, txe/yoeb family [Pseudoleptotrichia goodfellowii]